MLNMFRSPRLIAWLLAAPLGAQSLAELTEQLAAAEAYEDELVDDRPSTVHALYRQLAAAASPRQLLELTSHDVPIVRCYATRALAEGGHHARLPDVVGRHLLDQDAVKVHKGTARYQTCAGDLIFELARPRLAPRSLHRLAERMVREDCPLYAREWALRNLRFGDGMLALIRRLADEGDSAAAIAMARYRLKADVVILVRHLERPCPFDDDCRFLAAEISRDPRLMTALEKLESAAIARLRRDDPYRLLFWLRAVTAQRSGRAVDFLTHLLLSHQTEDRRKLEGLRATILEAIEEHPDPIFAELLAELRDGH